MIALTEIPFPPLPALLMKDEELPDCFTFFDIPNKNLYK